MVDSLLRQGTAVRAVTRNPESGKAKALAKRGVEVVQGDLADKASLVEVHSAHLPSPFPIPMHAPMHVVHGRSKCGCACMSLLCVLAASKFAEALQCHGLGLDAGYEAGALRLLCH